MEQESHDGKAVGPESLAQFLEMFLDHLSYLRRFLGIHRDPLMVHRSTVRLTSVRC